MVAGYSLGRPVVILSAERGRLLRFEDPKTLISAATPSEVPAALEALQAAVTQGFYAAGWIGYEAGAFLANDRLVAAAGSPVPLLWFGIFSAPTAIERKELVCSNRAYAGPLAHEWSRSDYGERFRRVQAHIAEGDIYQANLSFRSRFRFIGDPLALFLRLYDAAQVPHAAYIDTGEIQVLSLSPELFFKIHDGTIEAQPMKGTAARGDSSEDDVAAREALFLSQKNRAENIMIVDLMRNDLGRVAKPGSVRVSELLGLRSYPTFHTLISTVKAELPSSVTVAQLFPALMPAGSITGAPKLRAIEILNQLETSPREIYCGAIGHMAPTGDASFNVAIRTLWLNGSQGTTGIGGGVVADSEADAEYDECILKASWFEESRRPIALIETLRWDSNFVRLERHLDRMALSAKELSIPFARGEAYRVLTKAVSDCRGLSRVRLELRESGDLYCTTDTLTVENQAWRFAISSERISSQDRLLAHKTTWRDLYEHERERLCANGAADEVLFLNERDELTEGSRTNIFLRLGRSLFTPAAECGLLPGILRAEMIERAECAERVLTLQDLARADDIYLGNSLRGLIRAVRS
jgi:para-aminobenzoate synthetase/4-amino-4-deoxychorismate lyase